MSTQVTIIGTIATEPRLVRTAAANTPFCSFRLASNERRYDREKSQWVDSGTNWFTVNAFRGLAEHSSASFAKGDRVVINGRLRVRQWENGEKSGVAVEVEAEALGHDVRWGVSRFEKRRGSDAANSRASGDAADEVREPGAGETGEAAASDPSRRFAEGGSATSSSTWTDDAAEADDSVPIRAAA